MPWWASLLMAGLVLAVLVSLCTLLAVLIHMYDRHGIAVHWRCDEEDDNEYHESPIQDWEVRR